MKKFRDMDIEIMEEVEEKKELANRNTGEQAMEWMEPLFNLMERNKMVSFSVEYRGEIYPIRMSSRTLESLLKSVFNKDEFKIFIAVLSRMRERAKDRGEIVQCHIIDEPNRRKSKKEKDIVI